MTPPDPEETFKVTDRRRRADDDDVPPPPSASASTPEAESGPSLADLFMMLANTAVMALDQDPGHAGAMIELLVLLRAKTEGHRTAEETQTLEQLITELERRYVETVNRSG